MTEILDALRSIPWLFTGCVFVLSLLVGSFLNVVIHRLPIMLERQWRDDARATLGEEFELVTVPQRYNLVVPRSACPHCGAEVTALQNIPLVSWLALGGKCAGCRAPISARYPLVELGTALLSAAVAWHFGCHWQAAAALVFTWALVALTAIDLDHQLLPDAITLPLLWLGLLLSLFWRPGLVPPAPVDSTAAITGAVFGYLSLWLVYWGFKLLTGKEGMGYGDFKLLAAIGAWMGWEMLPIVILLSALAGSTVGVALVALRGRDRNVPMSFGPFLALAAWIALMWGPQISGNLFAWAGLE